MTNPRLSVCIATLNRGAFIGQTLDSIIAQATDEVEIIIVDGASTDNTEAVVTDYQSRFPRLRYLRLAAKGGVDRDYDRTVELAQGDYCWLMSDDDLLRPGAIATVLNALRQDYALVIANAEVKSFDFSAVTVPSLMPLQAADRVYSPAEMPQLLRATGMYLSFIGGVIIQRRLWLGREREKYFGTEFIHVGVIFQAPLPGPALVISQPQVSIRYGNAQWSSRYFQIWALKWPGLIWSLPGYPDAIRRQVGLPLPEQMQAALLAKVLLILRAKSAYSSKEYHQFLASRLTSRSARLAAQAITLIPGPLVHLLVLVYFQLRRSHDLYALAEFRSSPFYYRNVLRRLFARPAT